jgi:hypothetical protein
MRGQSKTVKTLTLSGNVYLSHINEKELENPKSGDVCLYLNDEEELFAIIMNDYKIKGYKGYFKAKIFDGYDWGMLNNNDFFEDKLNHFSKSEICFYSFQLCQARIENYSKQIVYRTYREHYTLHQHIAGEYKGRKGKKK